MKAFTEPYTSNHLGFNLVFIAITIHTIIAKNISNTINQKDLIDSKSSRINDSK